MLFAMLLDTTGGAKLKDMLKLRISMFLIILLGNFFFLISSSYC